LKDLQGFILKLRSILKKIQKQKIYALCVVHLWFFLMGVKLVLVVDGPNVIKYVTIYKRYNTMKILKEVFYG